MGLLGNLLGLAVDVVKTPLAAAGDVLSGRLVTDERVIPATKKAVKDVAKDIENLLDIEEDDDE